MKTRKRTQVNLDSVIKLQVKLSESEQERRKLKKLYTDKATEQYRVERLLKIEIEHTAFYSDCAEYLHLALFEAKNLTKEEIEGKMKSYAEFRNKSYRNFQNKRDRLNRVDVSLGGKPRTFYADYSELSDNSLSRVRLMLEKEQAITCYLHDCREALITSLNDVNNACTQVNGIREKFAQFDLMASKRLTEKIRLNDYPHVVRLYVLDLKSVL